MQFVTNLMSVEVHPGEWAARREAEGWPVLSVADHLYTSNRGRAFPHVWVSAAAMAAATRDAIITTAFVNNLLRSPVEVAQAALQMQIVSGGRFELGLGAGWARAEIIGAGLDYPDPRDRAGAFIEAARIIRELLHDGTVTFSGQYYQVDIPQLGPLTANPPPLVASVGGPRTAREVTPYCDRVEIKASSASTRDGALDLGVMASIPDDHLTDMIQRVRAVDPDIPLGMFVLCNAGEDDFTRGLQETFDSGGGLYRRFFGPPGHVAEGLAWLEEQGISRAQLSPFNDASLERLAPLVL